MNGYFHKVQEKTGTRFWINNPTYEEAKMAIEAGAQGCTTNPSYVSKLISSKEELSIIKNIIWALLPYEMDDSAIAEKVQRVMVGRLCDLFLPLYESSNGTTGFVTIQGNPLKDQSVKAIIEQGIEDRKIAKNIMIKIPAIEAGIDALSFFVKHNIPVLATEVMSISQANSVCERFRMNTVASDNRPVFFVTHITGILDDYFKEYVAKNKIDVSTEALHWAGLAIAKREYALLQQGGYPICMMAGGARKLEDFTELVGGELIVTINWKGTADVLLEHDPPVISRIDVPIDTTIISELKSSMRDFLRAWEINGMTPSEYYDFGGVRLFRESFVKGWNQLLDLIADQRRYANACQI